MFLLSSFFFKPGAYESGVNMNHDEGALLGGSLVSGLGMAICPDLSEILFADGAGEGSGILKRPLVHLHDVRRKGCPTDQRAPDLLFRIQ